MKRNLLSVALVVATTGFLSAQTVTDSLNFTGGIQTFTVPCGVTSLTIETFGAQGGSGANGNSGSGATLGGAGGLGGYSTGTLAVNPGDVLNIFVGGQGATPTGGFNGGANGGSQNAGGGGGATDIRVGGTAEANRVLTAGGGGGGGRGGCESQVAIAGGAGSGGGSGLAGTNGQDAPTSGGAAGGGKGGNFGNVQGALGAAGIGCGGFLGAPGGTASTGTGAAGGAGQSCCCFSFGSIPAGGGGGGGQLGGGGGGGGSAGTSGCSGNDKGAGGGGGGGSSFTGGVTNPTTTASIRTGNGVVKITYSLPTPTATTISGLSAICLGDTTTFTASTSVNATTYTWTVPSGLTLNAGQGTQSIQVTGATAGMVTITCEPVNGTCAINGPLDTFVVMVNALPNVVASANPIAICAGDTATLAGTGASSYVWNTSDTSSTISVTPGNTTMYTVTGTDVNGCVSVGMVLLTVNQLPVVTLSLPSGIICAADGDFALTGGSPAGGTYSGSFVTAGNFSPATAGVGSSTVTYMYTDSSGCSASNSDTITVDVCSGVISSNNSLGVILMPNPTTEVLNVTWNTNKATVNTLEVFDNTGRLVMTQVVNGGNQAALDVTSLPAGNYSLKVSSSNVNSQSFSFMKK